MKLTEERNSDDDPWPIYNIYMQCIHALAHLLFIALVQPTDVQWYIDVNKRHQ